MNLEKEEMMEKTDSASRRPRDRKPVLIYIILLFAVAFLLMALSFFMHQRSNSEVLGELKDSMGSIQSMQELQDKLIQAQEDLADAQEELGAADDADDARIKALQEKLDEQTALLAQSREDLSRAIRAMDLFWQIDEAYVLGRNERCRELIQTLEAQELAAALPTGSTTDNGRFSPYDRYAEICEALKEPYGAGVRP